MTRVQAVLFILVRLCAVVDVYEEIMCMCTYTQVLVWVGARVGGSLDFVF